MTPKKGPLLAKKPSGTTFIFPADGFVVPNPLPRISVDQRRLVFPFPLPA